MSTQFIEVSNLITNLFTVCFSLIQVIIVVVATVLAVRQLKENTKVRQVEVMDKIFEYVSATEAREARTKARELELPKDLGQLPNDQKTAIELTLIRWARIGVLLEQAVFQENDVDNYKGC